MKQKQFTQEFKDEVVRQCLTGGRRHSDVARDLGIGLSTLERWLGHARSRLAPSGEETIEAELARLRRENAILREERDILKKATAFFASETRPRETRR
jgi:transposase